MSVTEQELWNFVDGADGTGMSPYDIWLSLGNEGTAQDFLNYLRGGTDGASPYEIWKSIYGGTQQEYLDFLRGEGMSVIDNLESNSATHSLSARQGKILKNNRIVSLDEIDLVTEEGFFADALSVKELKETLINGIVDNLLSTATKLPVSANQARILNEKLNSVDNSYCRSVSVDFSSMSLEEILKYIDDLPNMTIIGRIKLSKEHSPTGNSGWCHGFIVLQNSASNPYDVDGTIMLYKEYNMYYGQIHGTTEFSITWQEIPTATPIKEAMTLSAACTLQTGSTNVRKVGKMCFFSIVITVKGNGQTSSIGVATLPSGCAPDVDFAIACPVLGDSSKEHAVCQFYKGNRNIYLYAPSDKVRTYAITGSYTTA